MLELHVWGPAFSLPSIDAHCLAAIAYLQQALPRGKWQLVASSDPTLSPTNELPALRNGDIWIGGFRNIFHYLAQYSAGEWVLDAGLPGQQGADCIAFSSFIEFHGQPLLDLSLYVSSLNYTATTRPLFNTLQSFPLPYITPPALRAAAKLRTSHLNLSSLDIDSEDGQSPPERSIIPESLRRPKNTISSLLAVSPETNAQIRLDALATDFFEPVSGLKGRKNYFVSENQISSLDCLALGYLSLMLIPQLPQPWLAKTMRKKFPGLCNWTEELGKTVYGGPVNLDDAFLTQLGDSEEDERRKRIRGKGALPWKAPENDGLVAVWTQEEYENETTWGKDTKSWDSALFVAEPYDVWEPDNWNRLVARYRFQQDIICLRSTKEPEKEGSARLRAFREAGAALSILANQMAAEAQMQLVLERNYTHGDPIVEVDAGIKVETVKTTEVEA